MTTSCAHQQESVTFGVQPEHRGFVPARTAVLNCRVWPNRTSLQDTPPANIRPPELDGLCAKLDEKTLGAFAGQPYMRGYSPKGVDKVLTRAGQGSLTQSWPKFWEHRAGDCSDCKDIAAFYTASIASRPEWREWLQTFSVHMNQADAILLPFVVYGREHIFDDRGMYVAERDAAVGALLIATGTGDLIWAGGRTALARNQRLQRAQVAEAITYPEWTVVMDRLFVSDLWRDFPGRQEF